jgi:mannosyltransferase OCH1-like enzyme
LPEKYVERLKTINFPYKLLGEEDYNEFKDFFNFSADISVGKRADAFRLRYIWKYGGVYADIDTIIDYQCLMMNFQGLNGTYFSKGQDGSR